MSRVPLIGSQVPGVHRYMIGSAEVTAVLDGYTDVDTGTIRNADPQKISETLRAHFLPENGTLRVSINAFIVNTGSELTLIDAGGRTTSDQTWVSYCQTFPMQGIMQNSSIAFCSRICIPITSLE